MTSFSPALEQQKLKPGCFQREYLQCAVRSKTFRSDPDFYEWVSLFFLWLFFSRPAVFPVFTVKTIPDSKFRPLRRSFSSWSRNTLFTFIFSDGTRERTGLCAGLCIFRSAGSFYPLQKRSNIYSANTEDQESDIWLWILSWHEPPDGSSATDLIKRYIPFCPSSTTVSEAVP